MAREVGLLQAGAIAESLLRSVLGSSPFVSTILPGSPSEMGASPTHWSFVGLNPRPGTMLPNAKWSSGGAFTPV